MMTTLSAGLALLVAQGNSIQSYVQNGFRDVSLTARVQSGNQRELTKISKDFGFSYRFSYTNLSVKEPFRFRAESMLDDTKLTVIQNGMTEKFNTPIYHGTQNLSKAPGRVHTPLELGILTPSMFDDFMTARFVRMDRATGNAVFDITFVPRLDDTSRFRVWIDPQKKYTTRREWYGQGKGNLKATFIYDEPREFNGVWLPTRSSVRNADNIAAGSLTYQNVKVNQDLSDALFKVK